MLIYINICIHINIFNIVCILKYIINTCKLNMYLCHISVKHEVCVNVCVCLCVCVCVNVFEMMYVKFVLSISRQRQLSHQENKFDKLFEAMRM